MFTTYPFFIFKRCVKQTHYADKHKLQFGAPVRFGGMTSKTQSSEREAQAHKKGRDHKNNHAAFVLRARFPPKAPQSHESRSTTKFSRSVQPTSSHTYIIYMIVHVRVCALYTREAYLGINIM